MRFPCPSWLNRLTICLIPSDALCAESNTEYKADDHSLYLVGGEVSLGARASAFHLLRDITNRRRLHLPNPKRCLDEAGHLSQRGLLVLKTL